MAYVFGLEGVPIFEMLFIIMFLMLVGFIFMLLELHNLRKLILEEKMDISRFETDLSKFEKEEGEKPSDDLKSYVRTARNKGITDDQIKQSLTKRGWDTKQVQQFFNSLKK